MKVSVVTGFYNRGHVLERTVRSILSQTFDDFELLVFDDASTDETQAIFRRLEQELDDPRLRYLRFDKNQGFTRCLVTAIGITSGEYIAIQGSGDVSLPRRLELQVRRLDEDPTVGAVGCWYSNIEETSDARRLRQPRADGVRSSDLLKGNVFSHGEVMIRRSAYDAVGGYRTEFTYSQDYDLWLRLAKVANLATVPEELYGRYILFDGVTYDYNKLLTQSRFSIAARRLSLMGEEEQTLALEQIRRSGPESLVPVTDRELQAKFARASVRFTVWGDEISGARLAAEYVSNKVVRQALILFARIYSGPLALPVKAVVRRVLRVQSNSGRRVAGR